MFRGLAAAALLLGSSAHAGEGCNALDGTYRNESEPAKHFASTATVAYNGRILQMTFRDSEGKAIVTYPADYPVDWTCKGSQFEATHEGFSGIGNDVVEIRTHTTLTRLESGDLQMAAERTDSRSKEPAKRSVLVFRGVPTPAN